MPSQGRMAKGRFLAGSRNPVYVPNGFDDMNRSRGAAMPNKKPGARVFPKGLKPFATLPASTLDELLKKGRKSAGELNKSIRSQFELSNADSALRLR